MQLLSLFRKEKISPKDVEQSQLLKSVKIGNQVWMASNLNIDHFRNGDIIPEARTDADWVKAGYERKAAWCYYNNNPENGEVYGKLYNKYAVNDPRGLAPKKWHIPSEKEFQILIEKGTKDGNTLKEKGQGTGGGAGTNTSSFAALLAGYRHYHGWFIDLGSRTIFWSSTVNRPPYSANLTLMDWDGCISLYSDHARFGYSVRCIRD
jgi:uncharacterized protein (TIGR02145 family)